LRNFATRKEAPTLASHVQWRHREATEHLDLVDARRRLPQAADYRDRRQSPGVYAVFDPAGNEM
jgi:hypothetical protein